MGKVNKPKAGFHQKPFRIPSICLQESRITMSILRRPWIHRQFYFQLLLCAIVAVAVCCISAAAETRGAPQGSSSSISSIEFPSVYKINLPVLLDDDESHHKQQDLLSGLDIMNVECHETNMTTTAYSATTTTRTAATYKAARVTNDFCKVSSLFHSQRELDFFQSSFDIFAPEETIMTGTIPASSLYVFEYDSESTESLISQEQRKMMKQELVHSSSSVNDERSEPKQEERQQRQLQDYSTINSHSCFLDMDGMNDWIDDLLQSPPDHLDVTRRKIGESYLKSNGQGGGGYDIHALRITAATSPIPYEDRAPMLILTSVHAREYSPPELVRRWVLYLADNADGDDDAATFLETTVIHWIPYVNPDGRALAETTQPFRRKNVNPTDVESQFCFEDEFGVDLNRNFPFRWGLASGSTGRGCLQTFRGEAAMSEPETKAVVNYAESIFPSSQRKSFDDFAFGGSGYDEDTTTGMFIDVHSFGNYYIYPWGFANSETPNHVALDTLVSKMVYFTGYDSRGPGNDFSSPASGATDDFAYGVLGAAGMTWEIGNAFHQNCAQFESMIVDDNIQAFNYAASIAHRPYTMSQGPDIIRFDLAPDTITFGFGLRIEIETSDYSGGRPELREIQMYINKHPFASTTNGPDLVFDESVLSSDGEMSVTLSNQFAVGSHSIYAQAMNRDGYLGPIASATLIVEVPATERPTASPSLRPTSQPSVSPTSSPSATPSTSQPSMKPTSSPFEDGSIGSLDNNESGECTDDESSTICVFVASNVNPTVLCRVPIIAFTCPLTCGLCDA